MDTEEITGGKTDYPALSQTKVKLTALTRFEIRWVALLNGHLTQKEARGVLANILKTRAQITAAVQEFVRKQSLHPEAVSEPLITLDRTRSQNGFRRSVARGGLCEGNVNARAFKSHNQQPAMAF